MKLLHILLAICGSGIVSAFPMCTDGSSPLMEMNDAFPCRKGCPLGFNCEYQDPTRNPSNGVCCADMAVLQQLYGDDNQDHVDPIWDLNGLASASFGLEPESTVAPASSTSSYQIEVKPSQITPPKYAFSEATEKKSSSSETNSAVSVSTDVISVGGANLTEDVNTSGSQNSPNVDHLATPDVLPAEIVSPQSAETSTSETSLISPEGSVTTVVQKEDRLGGEESGPTQDSEEETATEGKMSEENSKKQEISRETNSETGQEELVIGKRKESGNSVGEDVENSEEKPLRIEIVEDLMRNVTDDYSEQPNEEEMSKRRGEEEKRQEKQLKYSCTRQKYRFSCHDGNVKTQPTIRWFWNSERNECEFYPWGYCPGDRIVHATTIRSKLECEEHCSTNEAPPTLSNEAPPTKVIDDVIENAPATSQEIDNSVTLPPYPAISKNRRFSEGRKSAENLAPLTDLIETSVELLSPPTEQIDIFTPNLAPPTYEAPHAENPSLKSEENRIVEKLIRTFGENLEKGENSEIVPRDGAVPPFPPTDEEILGVSNLAPPTARQEMSPNPPYLIGIDDPSTESAWETIDTLDSNGQHEGDSLTGVPEIAISDPRSESKTEDLQIGQHENEGDPSNGVPEIAISDPRSESKTEDLQIGQQETEGNPLNVPELAISDPRSEKVWEDLQNNEKEMKVITAAEPVTTNELAIADPIAESLSGDGQVQRDRPESDATEEQSSEELKQANKEESSQTTREDNVKETDQTTLEDNEEEHARTTQDENESADMENDARDEDLSHTEAEFNIFDLPKEDEEKNLVNDEEEENLEKLELGKVGEGKEQNREEDSDDDDERVGSEESAGEAERREESSTKEGRDGEEEEEQHGEDSETRGENGTTRDEADAQEREGLVGEESSEKETLDEEGTSAEFEESGEKEDDDGISVEAEKVDAALECSGTPYRFLCSSGMPSQFVYRWQNVNGKCQSFPYGYCYGEFNHGHPRTYSECEEYCLEESFDENSILNRVL